MDRVTEIYNTMCKTDSQWEFAVRLQRGAEGTANQTGALQQAEGWGGKGDGRGFWEGGDMDVSMADSC